MMKWQKTLNVSDLWARAKAGDITPARLGALLSARVKGYSLFGTNAITKQLESLPEDATFDDFDIVMERLYNWADCHKRLWIKTF